METIQIGYTRKNHGLKGEIKFHVEDAFFDDFMDADVVLIEVNNKKKPYFIEDIRAGNNTIVKLEDVDTPEAAAQLNHCAIFLRVSDISDENHTEDDFYPYRHTVGYTLYNNADLLGIIESLEEFPQQLMAVISAEPSPSSEPLVLSFEQTRAALNPYKVGTKLKAKQAQNSKLIPLNPAFVKKIDDAKKIITLDLPEGMLEL